MSAPLSQQLFHGTIETLKPGDVVKPRGNGADHDTSGIAWATKSLEYAQKHTIDRIGSGLGYSEVGQHPHHGNIYEVEPIHGDEVKANDKELLGDENTVVSKRGFKVKAHVASVLNPDLGARKHRDPITNKPKDIWA